MRLTMLNFPPILRPVCAGLAALAACLAASPALALVQTGYPGAAVYAETTPAALARNLRVLASSPRNFEALIGAGRAALALGDTQSAVGFFGRAEEVNPPHPAPKAGTGAALVAMEQPVEALGYFSEAVRLGANQASIGADRGLAYDLTGEPARAQADYRAALFGQDRDEARRRLALSLAMGKDRAGALAAIAPLMSRRDPATERVRAFVLALVGDVAGARQVVEAAMPGAAANMEPFLRKLARMSPDQAVGAVHFGHFPDDSEIRLAAVTPPPMPGPASRSSVTRSAPRQSQPRTAAPAPAQSKPAASQRERVYYVPFDNRARQIISKPVAKPPAARPVAAAPVKAQESPTVAPGFTSAPPPVVASAVPEPSPAARPELAPVETAAMASTESNMLTPVQPQPPPVEIASASSTPAVDRLSDIEKLLGSPDEPIVRIPTTASQDELAPEDSAPPPSKPKIETAAQKKLAAKKGKAKPEAVDEDDAAPAKKAKAAAKAPKSPGKYWVQLAGGAKTERMPVEYKRIKGKKPALFAKRTAYVAELKGWTRLLVGPFKSEDESQEFVNQLAKADIDGFSWTSPTGQAIEKLPPK